MKISFFDTENPQVLKIPERLCIYILSFLTPEELKKNSALVNKAWNDLVKKTNNHVALMPTIQRIPQLQSYSLGQLGIYPLSGGMTNRTFKLRLKKTTRWVLRVPGEGASAFIRRDEEAHNARQASNLGINVAIEFFDPKDGLQLTRYLENNKLCEELKTNPLILQTVASVMKRLHSSALFLNEVNMFSRNKQLLSTLKTKHSDILPVEIKSVEEAMDEIEKLVNHYNIPLCPCHNDTTPDNFLVAVTPANDSQEKIVKLHDFEYAANNDRIVDIVYFFWAAQLTAEEIKLFATSYFGDCNDSILAWFELYKPVIGWWYTVWSWTQLANKANGCEPEAYKELAAISYKNTMEQLATEAFKQAFDLIENETQSVTFTATRGF